MNRIETFVKDARTKAPTPAWYVWLVEAPAYILRHWREVLGLFRKERLGA